MLKTESETKQGRENIELSCFVQILGRILKKTILEKHRELNEMVLVVCIRKRIVVHTGYTVILIKMYIWILLII